MAAILKCGLIGAAGTCLAIPSLLYVKSRNDLYELVDFKKISETEPILDCEDHGRHYQIYLTAKEGGQWTISEALASITMSVFDVKNNDLSWGGTKKLRNKQWTNWRLRVTNANKVSLEIPQKNLDFSESGYISLTCKKGKIAPKISGHGSELVITGGHSQGSGSQMISFKLEDGPACQNAGKRRECGIVFGDSTNLKWIDEFKPKAYFYY